VPGFVCLSGGRMALIWGLANARPVSLISDTDT
jgi:hypothetical protein